jgi:hypothetical protein
MYVVRFGNAGLNVTGDGRLGGRAHDFARRVRRAATPIVTVKHPDDRAPSARDIVDVVAIVLNGMCAARSAGLRPGSIVDADLGLADGDLIVSACEQGTGGIQEGLTPRRNASRVTPVNLPLTTRKAVAPHVGDARRALAAELHLLPESGPDK